jgi:hypothetical protein
MASGASVAALACGDDDTGSSASVTSASSGSAGGGTTSGAGGGTTSGAGGATATGSGGATASGTGGAAHACTGALLVKGSNYGKDPHDLSIPIDDLNGGVSKTYESTGNGHTHNVTLTAADFDALRNGETVKKYTCLQNPNYADHEWVFSCADPNIMPTFEGEIGTPSNCPG